MSMPKWMRVLIGLGIALLSCGVYLCFFGVQTFCALEARYEARKLPFVRNTPIGLVDSSASQNSGKRLSYFGFEFEVPWDDIDEAKSRIIGGNKALIAFRSGNALLVLRGSSHEFVDNFLKDTNIDPETFRKLFGAEALASDYNFNRIMYAATPNAITPFLPKKEAITEEMLLIVKGISIPRGAESGIFLVTAGEFKGFQFGRPSKAPNGFSVQLYSATVSLDFIFGPKLNGPTAISQADVNRILQTLHKVPVETTANVTSED
jgi:hypothetical protein